MSSLPAGNMEDDGSPSPVRVYGPGRLPRESFRDYFNEFQQDLKFRYVPFRGYYRLRAHKYMWGKYPELGILRYVVDGGRTSLDVGANLGLYTYFLARYSAHVYAFEPNPFPLRVLSRVADRNVTVLQMALSERGGEIDLVVPKGRRGWSNNGAAVGRKFRGRTATVRVPCGRIDDLDLSAGPPGVGFIKIDVEGHELQVLRGAEATLRRDRPKLLIENEIAHVGGGVDAVFAMMAALDGSEMSTT